MHPILFTIGPFKIYSYGFFLALAFLSVTLLSEKEAKKRSINLITISNFCLISLIAGVAGARLLFIIMNIDIFISSPKEIIMFQHGGLVWYGGLISALISGFSYLKLKKQDILGVLDLMAPYLALGQAIGRIGCLLNGCCFGKFWPLYNTLYPTQAISSLSMLVIFFTLKTVERRNPSKGKIFILYLICYSMARFFIEFLRGDSPPFVGILTLFQVISVVIFSVSMFFYFAGLSNKGKN
ncbi:MAG TPA: prolipoprotein diacylglyceryl transferase [Candidatus Omnitrophica bacterium]|nr:prolipoprotein diacylglyceryl transferase [Candidatus Omnitrophota bacterium]